MHDIIAINNQTFFWGGKMKKIYWFLLITLLACDIVIHMPYETLFCKKDCILTGKMVDGTKFYIKKIGNPDEVDTLGTCIYIGKKMQPATSAQRASIVHELLYSQKQSEKFIGLLMLLRMKLCYLHQVNKMDGIVDIVNIFNEEMGQNPMNSEKQLEIFNKLFGNEGGIDEKFFMDSTDNNVLRHLGNSI